MICVSVNCEAVQLFINFTFFINWSTSITWFEFLVTFRFVETRKRMQSGREKTSYDVNLIICLYLMTKHQAIIINNQKVLKYSTHIS